MAGYHPAFRSGWLTIKAAQGPMEEKLYRAAGQVNITVRGPGHSAQLYSHLHDPAFGRAKSEVDIHVDDEEEPNGLAISKEPKV